MIGPDFPDPGLYKGLEGINRYMGIFLEPWEKLTIESEEIEQVGDSVVALVRQAGTGKSTGIETEFRYWQVWTFADGKVVHWQNYRDREGAVEAAGSPEG